MDWIYALGLDQINNLKILVLTFTLLNIMAIHYMMKTIKWNKKQ